MQIVKIEFGRDLDGRVDPRIGGNAEKIREYVLPVIAKNRGWGTADLTLAAYESDPAAWRLEIDNVLEIGPEAVNWVALLNQKPVGLLSALQTDLVVESEFGRMLFEMLDDRGSGHWRFFLSKKVFEEKIVERYRRLATGWLYRRKLYSSVGVVVAPVVQNQRLGISEQLYGQMADGVKLGWTSNPIVVYKRRQLFSRTFFLPWMEEKVETLEQFMVSLLVYVDLATSVEGEWDDMLFGTQKSVYFVKDRGKEYLEIARKLALQNKITQLDLERCEYILGHERMAGAVVSL